MRAALRIVLAGVPAGVLAGLAWWLLAPQLRLRLSGGGAFLVGGEANEAAVATDGWFAVCGAVAGAVVALVVVLRRRAHDVGELVALVVGGLLGSVVAWKVGGWLGPDAVAAQARSLRDGAVVTAPLQVRATGVLLVWPLVSVIVYFATVAGAERHADHAVAATPDTPDTPTDRRVSDHTG